MAELVEKRSVQIKRGLLSYKENSVLSNNEQAILIYGLYKLDPESKDLSVEFSVQEMKNIMGIELKAYDYNRNLATGHLGNFKVIDMNNNEIEKTTRIRPAFKEITFIEPKNRSEGPARFRLVFNECCLPEIVEQKRLYYEYGLTPISKFKCKYTIMLYEYLKKMYFNFDWRVEKGLGRNDDYFDYISFIDLFNVDVKSNPSLARTDNFKKRVWKPAMDEINKYTGYRIVIETSGRGKSYTFHLIVNEIEMIVKPVVKTELKTRLLEPVTEYSLEGYAQRFKKQIHYADILVSNEFACHTELLDQIVNVAAEVFISNNKTKTIKGKKVSIEDVKTAILQVNEVHVRAIMRTVIRNEVSISNKNSYLLSCLFTSVMNFSNATMNLRQQGIEQKWDREPELEISEEEKQALLEEIRTLKNEC